MPTYTGCKILSCPENAVYSFTNILRSECGATLKLAYDAMQRVSKKGEPFTVWMGTPEKAMEIALQFESIGCKTDFSASY